MLECCSAISEMCDTPFKTPLPFRTPRSEMKTNFCTNSDSDESVTSSNSDTGSVGTPNLSLEAEFDDLMRYARSFKKCALTTEPKFLSFVEQMKLFYVQHFQAVDECHRLQALLDAKIHECSDLDHKLQKARRLLDIEKGSTRNARRERDDYLAQINLVRDLLFKDKASNNRLSDEMRRKLSFLHNNNIENEWEAPNQNGNPPQLSAIKEINTTGSILSEFSYSRSEDDIDGSILPPRAWKKHRPSTGEAPEPATKKRRSSGNRVVEIGATDAVRATTTLTVLKDGPITATSVIESIPKTPGATEVNKNQPETYSSVPSNLVFESWNRQTPVKPERRLNSREHCFEQKVLVMPETCTVCQKRARFAKTVAKCKECKAVCHIECKDSLPLPCIPNVRTPNQKNGLGVIGDYTPTTPPMVPALLIHCINEIELRGFTEVGIYRVPGAERDVKSLKDRFLKGKGAPCLNQIDVHVICGTVKDFLRSLQEPLVTYGLWNKFVQAVEAKDPIDIKPALFQVISELPQPNRDTLAYMILHLQKVSEVKACKMSASNLAKVFGPTIVGYSSSEPNANVLLDETVQQYNVLEQLLNIPSDYWSAFVNVERYQYSRLQQTPSTDSLLRSTPRGFFTPVNRNTVRKQQKFFPSPDMTYR